MINHQSKHNLNLSCVLIDGLLFSFIEFIVQLDVFYQNKY